MEYSLDIEVQLVCERILDKGSVLLFGNSEDTLKVLKKAYEELSKNNEFLCSYIQASEVKEPLDFFTPILKLKFGENYRDRIKSFFELHSKYPDRIGIFHLTDYCGQESEGKTENERKLPIIFVEGIEELLFKLDFPNGLNKREEGIGNSLRGGLHQTKKAIFCGNVKNDKSIAYKSTLGNYGYMFYEGNFAIQIIE